MNLRAEGLFLNIYTLQCINTSTNIFNLTAAELDPDIIKNVFLHHHPTAHSSISSKDVIQGKLFQKCTHLLYCSVLSLGGNVNTRRMSKPDMGSIFHIKKSMKYSGHRKLLCELSKFNAFNIIGY